MCFSFAEHRTLIGSTETRVTSSTNQNQSRLWRVHFAAFGRPGVSHVYFCRVPIGRYVAHRHYDWSLTPFHVT